MIEIAPGAQPTADDMEILEMSLDSIQSALGYSGKTTIAIRENFNKIHADLNAFGAHLKQMMANVAKNLKEPQVKLQQAIAAGEAEIARRLAADSSCGVKGYQRLLGKISECKKIEDTLRRYKGDLERS